MELENLAQIVDIFGNCGRHSVESQPDSGQVSPTSSLVAKWWIFISVEYEIDLYQDCVEMYFRTAAYPETF